jgi:hypothetical protein
MATLLRTPFKNWREAQTARSVRSLREAGSAAYEILSGRVSGLRGSWLSCESLSLLSTDIAGQSLY